MKKAVTDQPFVLVTGSSGLIGSRLARSLRDDYRVVGLDLHPPSDPVLGTTWRQCDLTDRRSIAETLYHVRDDYGEDVASVVHLAAYDDFSAEPSPRDSELIIEGTDRLLRELSRFHVEQFVFFSPYPLMAAFDGGHPTGAWSSADRQREYPTSQGTAEQVIREQRGDIPAVILRIAGVYDEECHSLPIAEQIRRIYEKQLECYVFPGDQQCGQPFVHLDDLAACFRRVVEHRNELPPESVLVIGEQDVMSYEELQGELGRMIHGSGWPTIRIPKTVAKAGAWVKEKITSGRHHAPLINPGTIDLADQHYRTRVHEARKQLGWEPNHSLRHTLPEMIKRLREDPKRWYEINKLPIPDEAEAHARFGSHGS